MALLPAAYDELLGNLLAVLIQPSPRVCVEALRLAEALQESCVRGPGGGGGVGNGEAGSRTEGGGALDDGAEGGDGGGGGGWGPDVLGGR